MATQYELWDVGSGNLVAVYESEEAALESVRLDLHEHGRAIVETLALGTQEDDGGGRQIAAGDDLIARAEAAGPGRAARPEIATTARGGTPADR